MPDDERALFAIIGDEDTVSGFLLAGVGDVDERQRVNYFIVNEKTTEMEIAERFKELTAREDVAVLLITQIVADRVRYLVNEHRAAIPSVLEIPDKENPYDPSKDSVLIRVQHLLGGES